MGDETIDGIEDGEAEDEDVKHSVPKSSTSDSSTSGVAITGGELANVPKTQPIPQTIPSVSTASLLTANTIVPISKLLLTIFILFYFDS